MIPTAGAYSDHSSIYPGAYEPLPEQKKELSIELIKGTCVKKPPANFVEFNDYYRLEIAAPGFRREDFFIIANGGMLSVTARTKKCSKQQQEAEGFPDFTYECIHRDIVLPPDVDTDFVSAEYTNGILWIRLCRTSTPVVNKTGHIVVY